MKLPLKLPVYHISWISHVSRPLICYLMIKFSVSENHKNGDFAEHHAGKQLKVKVNSENPR